VSKPFTTLRATAVRLHLSNVDTDQIIPARFMRTPRNEGYARFLFHDLRFRNDGSSEPSFVLNSTSASTAQILLTGANFGCGSSREAAVYALSDFGLRCIIAPSFGEIFQNNCCKNGILPIVLPEATIGQLPASSEEIDIDLQRQTVGVQAREFCFGIDAFSKDALLTGLDDIDMTLRGKDRIAAFYESHLARRPWLRIQTPDV
jgi:3-isopropylmalate/(R)-2-methylmalate dehydratase small subunit